MQYNFTPQGDTVAVTVTAEPDPANVQVADGSYVFDALRIANVGDEIAFVRWGGEGVEASDTAVPILPNTVESFCVAGSAAMWVAAIGAGSTLYVTPGSGQ